MKIKIKIKIGVIINIKVHENHDAKRNLKKMPLLLLIEHHMIKLQYMISASLLNKFIEARQQFEDASPIN